MNQKDMRSMLADVLDIVAKLLPTTNEALSLAHAIHRATVSQDPKRAVLIDSHFERLLKPSTESMTQVLAAIEAHKAKLADDSLWNND